MCCNRRYASALVCVPQKNFLIIASASDEARLRRSEAHTWNKVCVLVRQWKRALQMISTRALPRRWSVPGAFYFPNVKWTIPGTASYNVLMSLLLFLLFLLMMINGRRTCAASKRTAGDAVSMSAEHHLHICIALLAAAQFPNAQLIVISSLRSRDVDRSQTKVENREQGPDKTTSSSAANVNAYPPVTNKARSEENAMQRMAAACCPTKEWCDHQ